MNRCYTFRSSSSKKVSSRLVQVPGKFIVHLRPRRHVIPKWKNIFLCGGEGNICAGWCGGQLIGALSYIRLLSVHIGLYHDISNENKKIGLWCSPNVTNSQSRAEGTYIPSAYAPYRYRSDEPRRLWISFSAIRFVHKPRYSWLYHLVTNSTLLPWNR